MAVFVVYISVDEAVLPLANSVSSDEAGRSLTAQQLIDRCSASVWKYASLIARDDQEAEDIAQESLFRAIRALPKFKLRQGGFEPWLWRIVQNTGHDFGRAARRRQMLQTRLSVLIDRQESTWPDLDRQVLSSQLIAAVRSLQARDRTLIALRYGGDLEFREVGRLVGLSAAAARAATRRALHSLRQQLEGRRQ